MQIIGVPEGEEEEQEIENSLEQIMKKNFPNLVKETDFHFSYEFMIYSSISTMKPVGVCTGITMNLRVSLGSAAILVKEESLRSQLLWPGVQPLRHRTGQDWGEESEMLDILS